MKNTLDLPYFNKDEKAILEGLISPYSIFGGSSLLKDEPSESIKRIYSEGLITQFYKTLNITKKFEGLPSGYIHESEVIDYLSLTEYKETKDFSTHFADTFTELNYLADQIISYEAEFIQLSLQIQENIKKYVENDKDFFIQKYGEEYNPSHKLKIYREVKSELFNSIFDDSFKNKVDKINNGELNL